MCLYALLQWNLHVIAAEKVGFNCSPPAYLSPQASGQNLLLGANFASAASGYYNHEFLFVSISDDRLASPMGLCIKKKKKCINDQQIQAERMKLFLVWCRIPSLSINN
jgi:hypothetical protein